MKKRDDNVAGPHDYWVHFWCGLAAGVVLGGIAGSLLSANVLAIMGTAVGSGGLVALGCGRYGEAAWEWVFAALEFLLGLL
jgi:hypothetical protein